MSTRTLDVNRDLPDVVQLSKDFFVEYERHDSEIFKVASLTDEGIERYFRSFFGQPDRLVIVEQLDERIVAYLTASIVKEADVFQINTYGNVSGMMVKKEYRRRGIARGLMLEAIQFFEDNGAEHFKLYTATANKNAIAFYKSMGMTELQTIMIGRTGSIMR